MCRSSDVDVYNYYVHMFEAHDCLLQIIMVPVIVVVGRFYTALFSALEQTHCARM